MSPHRCTCCIIPARMLRLLALQADTTRERERLLAQADLSAHLRDGAAAAAEATLGATALPATMLGLLPAGHDRRAAGVRPQRSENNPTAAAAPAADGARRTIYDAGGLAILPGTQVRTEGAGACGDIAADQAYDGAGLTHAFLRQILQRDSLDGHGMRLDATVHYQKNFNNAYWNGQQMVYGDGDGKLFSGFTGALDVIAHELGHGLVQHAVPGGLVYEGQSGALNESFADVFGSVVRQWARHESSAQADWLIGTGIMAPGVGKALRSLADPGNTALTWSGDDQPNTMAAYVDGGAVHTNSGIPNAAFHGACMALGGNAWDVAAPVWYHALRLLTPEASFADMAAATTRTAARRHGEHVSRAVQAAWARVGVTAASTATMEQA